MQARTVALAGNPNVGKSTVFNQLTGLRQHTGNWPGKTVEVARGGVSYRGTAYTLVDLPGSYSLLAHSREEEVARDFLCCSGPDAALVVCDASCLERNINLVLQVLEIQPRTVVCVNLMDEAKKRGITIDTERLAARLGVPVCGCAARSGVGLEALLRALHRVSDPDAAPPEAARVRYLGAIEAAVATVQAAIEGRLPNGAPPARWVALRLLEGDASMLQALRLHFKADLEAEAGGAIQAARQALAAGGMQPGALRDRLVGAIYRQAESICADAVRPGDGSYDRHQLRVDRLLTNRRTGIPAMLLLLAMVFWITLRGASAPSALLAAALFRVQDGLSALFAALHAPAWLHGALVMGVYRTAAWVVAVMLPPMAIFFPLFTLLEDAGYLPRVAFNLDRQFKRCGACGKQALTMCMGFGCNAVGVTGCRIIDSPRERMIAMLTNSFVPCNGRFPALIAILSMYFAGAGAAGSLLSAALLTLVIVLGVLLTLLSSRLLSKTLLRGAPSSFTLELPPFRRPRVGQVIVRSLLDRTAFVLGRAVAVAAPAGLLLWVLANVQVDGASLFQRLTGFLDPVGRALGMDGTILAAFALGFPANEIVLPIALMGYLSQGVITETPGLVEMKAILAQNGWTSLTALCTLLFTLLHWPCSTTCLTLRKETGSLKWTIAGFLLPTVSGAALCALVAFVGRLFL